MRTGSFFCFTARQAGPREQKLPVPPQRNGKGLPLGQTDATALSAILLIS